MMQAAWLVPDWLPWRQLAVVLVVFGSLLALRRLRDRPLTATLRERLLHGIPWGTLATVAILLVVYGVVQGGFVHPRNPVVLPFRSWAYDYPLGMLTAAFTHNGWGHLVNNVTATLAFGLVAEYAWGHYPDERGVQTFTSLRTNPYARIAAVPVAAVLVGLFTAVSGLGPLIGFSGVVFAIAGFAAMHRPLATVLALVGIRILRLLLSTMTDPEPTASIYSAVITPWWAEVAIQTHGVGFLLGLIAGAALCLRRDEWGRPLHVFFAVLVFAIAEGMWAIFLPLSGSSWLLLRWVGTAALFVLATLAAVAAFQRDRLLLSRIDLHRRELAIGLLVVGVLAMSLAAVPFKLGTAGEDPAPNGVVEVRDYTVGYAEGVPNGFVEGVSIPVVGRIPEIQTSGVIVTSEQRSLWRRAISVDKLANDGRVSVLVGGLGWRERVVANRTGWSVLGNATTYKVFLRRAGEPRRQAFASNGSTAAVTIGGRNVTIVPAAERFDLLVRRGNETLVRAPVPTNGTRRTVGGLTFERTNGRLLVEFEETRVYIARRV